MDIFCIDKKPEEDFEAHEETRGYPRPDPLPICLLLYTGTTIFIELFAVYIFFYENNSPLQMSGK